MIYVPRGLVCNIEDIETIKLLIKELEDIRKKNKVIVLKFDPQIEKNIDIYNLYKKNKFKIVSKQNLLIQPKFNMVIDVKDKSEKELLDSFASKTRYNINYSFRKNVKTYYSNRMEDLKIFYDLYVIMCKRKNIGLR